MTYRIFAIAPGKYINSVSIVAALLLLASTGQSASRKILVGHVPAAASKSQPIDKVPGSKRLDLAISLPLRNSASLADFLQQLYDPSSPNFHQYLTPEQFAQRFGPSEEDYQKVIGFAKQYGLTITGTHANRTLLDVSAPVSSLEQAFKVNLRFYKHPTEARTFFAPDNEPSVDSSLPILGASGLDDFNLPRPMGLRRNTARKSLEGTPNVTGSGPRGNFIGKDFRAAYAPGVELNGAGQTVGLFELDGYYPSDIAAYASLAGLPNVPLTNVLVNGFSGNPGIHNVEVALDVDMAVAMAPGLSSVIIYQGTVPNAVLNRMATDNRARQLSSSWSFGALVDAARQQIFQQFAAQGQSFFQASGDVGAYTGPVAAPSDDPFITVVGGTTLTTSPDGAWVSESTWSLSSGGISTTNTIPSWQRGISMLANKGSTTMRNLPDVACLGDEVIWVVADNGLHGVVGGTSASAPLWAGFTALVNQQAAATGKPSVGFVNPAIYALAQSSSYSSVLHDITTGNNTNSSSRTNFFATTGYDLCTGWGTPTGSNLINALLAPVGPLRITPQSAVGFAGQPSGPFSPGARTFVLTNDGVASLNWTLALSGNWLQASPVTGTLSPGGPATGVSITLTPAADSLAVGSYAATIWFTNLTDGFAQSRQVQLEVVAPVSITTQPSNQNLLEGATATFAVETAANATLSYQWRRNTGSGLLPLSDGPHFSGTRASTLIVSNVTPQDVGVYSVVVSNAESSVTSSTAQLTITPSLPVFITQPLAQTALPAQTVTLSVAVAGTRPLFYQWRKNENVLSAAANLSGLGTATLSIGNISPADAGGYSVMVSNTYGNVISSTALVSVVSVTAPGILLDTPYSFNGGISGANPGGLVQYDNDLFYGIFQNGGDNGSGGIFVMSASIPPSALYAFSGQGDGANPYGALVKGLDGNLYGTTFQGGTFDNGSIFQMTPNGVLSTLLAFNGTNGDFPMARLTLGSDSNFYGTSYQGGDYGRGTVFRITSYGAFSTIYSFSNGNDGGHLAAEVVQGPDGNLYGTTGKGGAFGRGTIFRLGTNGLLTTLLSFNGTNGGFPLAGLTKATDGSFYGVTSQGGVSSNGTIFKITSQGQFTSLYSFTNGIDGASPAAALLEASDGNFYGTAAYGGTYGNGTVFRLAPNNALTILGQFDGYNGANPQAAMIESSDGILYGTTRNGGTSGNGAIYRLHSGTAPQITTQPADQLAFAGANVQLTAAVSGSPPLSYRWQENGTNLSDGGNLSGSSRRVLVLTNVSGANSGFYSLIIANAQGSITSAPAFLQVTSSAPFIVTQPASQTVPPGTNVVLFVNALGDLPLSYQWQRSGTNLVDGDNVSGTSSNSITFAKATEANNGTYSVIVSNHLNSVTSAGAVLTIVPISAPGTRLVTLHGFTGGSDGGTPNGLALGTNGNLYGTTQFGGSSGFGRAFCMTPDGTITTLASFASPNGSIPRAGLVQGADGNFYGTTQYGGTAGVGTVFKLTANGTLTTLHSFTGGNDGLYPLAALIQGTDGNFYGTTKDGGNDYGTIFRMLPDGTMTILYAFTNGSDGYAPDSSLVQARDGNFYGMTGGGARGFGNVFRITPEGILRTVYTFTNGTDGSVPAGALVQGTDGNLYGVTKRNTIQGFTFNGTVFKVTTNGVLTTLYPFNFGEGAIPAAGLILASDGNFYGTTDLGGANSLGTVFRISPSGAYQTLVSFDGFNDGSHPGSALVEGLDGSLYGTTTAGGPGNQGTIFRLRVTSAPQITAQPANAIALVGETVALSVAVAGAPPLFYHWQKDSANLADTGNITGSTNRVLMVTNASFANNGNYSVVVSNALGFANSTAASLAVVLQPAFQSVIQTNGSVRVTWSAFAGQRYRLQFNSTLGTTNWTNSGSTITATSSSVTATNASGSAPQRFYRVQLLR
jgi:uncharacterized repeat protein (TIGR03803 family)